MSFCERGLLFLIVSHYIGIYTAATKIRILLVENNN